MSNLQTFQIPSGVTLFVFHNFSWRALGNNLAACLSSFVARLTALASLGLALRFRLAPQKPTVSDTNLLARRLVVSSTGRYPIFPTPSVE